MVSMKQVQRHFSIDRERAVSQSSAFTKVILRTEPVKSERHILKESDLQSKLSVGVVSIVP
jgi:hypothetical protein